MYNERNRDVNERPPIVERRRHLYRGRGKCRFRGWAAECHRRFGSPGCGAMSTVMGPAEAFPLFDAREADEPIDAPVLERNSKTGMGDSQIGSRGASPCCGSFAQSPFGGFDFGAEIARNGKVPAMVGLGFPLRHTTGDQIDPLKKRVGMAPDFVCSRPGCERADCLTDWSRSLPQIPCVVINELPHIGFFLLKLLLRSKPRCGVVIFPSTIVRAEAANALIPRTNAAEFLRRCGARAQGGLSRNHGPCRPVEGMT